MTSRQVPSRNWKSPEALELSFSIVGEKVPPVSHRMTEHASGTTSSGKAAPSSSSRPPHGPELGGDGGGATVVEVVGGGGGGVVVVVVVDVLDVEVVEVGSCRRGRAAPVELASTLSTVGALVEGPVRRAAVRTAAPSAASRLTG